MSAPAFPIVRATRIQRSLQAAVSYSESPFSYAGQSFDWGGRRWTLQIDMPPLEGQDAKTVSAFLASLGGPATVFTLSDPSISNTGVGAVTVVGAGQSGAFLATTGWTTAPDVGDFISLGSGLDARLYQITATSGTLPAQTLTLAPSLRSPPADGASVEVSAPIIALRLVNVPPMDIGLVKEYRISLSAVEAL